MAEDFNIVLEMLRAVRADNATMLDELRSQARRLTSVERHLANLHVDTTETRSDLEGLKSRIERIERRLELHDPGHGKSVNNPRPVPDYASASSGLLARGGLVVVSARNAGAGSHAIYL